MPPLMRNETEHPPFLSSVHISTHPNKKSRNGSRFVQSTSPDGKLLTHPGRFDHGKEPLKAEEASEEPKLHGIQDKKDTLISHLQTTSSITRACSIYLKTPNKAFNETLPQRSHFVPLVLTKKFHHRPNNPTEEQISKTLIRNRDSFESTTGTFSFGERVSAVQTDFQQGGNYEINQENTCINSLDEFSQCNPSTLPESFSQPSTNVVEKSHHRLNFKCAYLKFNTSTIEESVSQSHSSSVVSPDQDCNQMPFMKGLARPNSPSISLELKKHSEKFHDSVKNYDSSLEPCLTTSETHSESTFSSNQVEHSEYAQTCKNKASPALTYKSKVKPSRIIMCQVPATGEALLNKPLPLKAPSRRSVIPRKLPRPPTTGFSCDEPRQFSRYSRYVRLFESDSELRRKKRQHSTEKFSQDTPLKEDTTLQPDKKNLARRKNSPWTISVAFNISNQVVRASSRTRSTPIMISIESSNFTPEINESRQKNTYVKQNSLPLDSTAWKSRNLMLASQAFQLDSGLETFLNASLVGTLTCAWLWDILCSGSLWTEGRRNAQQLIKRLNCDGLKMDNRSCLRYVVFLLIYVVESLANALPFNMQTTKDFKYLRQAQEHQIFITVVRDTLKLWTQAAFKCLNEKFTQSSSCDFHDSSLSPLIPDTNLVFKTIQFKKDCLNKLKSAEKELHRLMEANPFFLLPHNVDSLSYLDQYIKRLHTCHTRFLHNEGFPKNLQLNSDDLKSLETIRSQLLIKVQEKARKKQTLETLVLYHRVHNWTAVLALWTLKSLEMYVKTRRRLKGLPHVPPETSERCISSGEIEPLHYDYIASSASHRNSFSANRSFYRRSESIVPRYSPCTWTFDCRLSYIQKPSSYLEPSLEDIMGGSVSRQSIGKSSAGRLSLLSYESLEDNIHRYSEVDEIQKDFLTPERVSFENPIRRAYSKKEDSTLSLGREYSSLRVSQHRKRRTTLGYTLRLQKPK